MSILLIQFLCNLLSDTGGELRRCEERTVRLVGRCKTTHICSSEESHFADTRLRAFSHDVAYTQCMMLVVFSRKVRVSRGGDYSHTSQSSSWYCNSSLVCADIIQSLQSPNGNAEITGLDSDGRISPVPVEQRWFVRNRSLLSHIQY